MGFIADAIRRDYGGLTPADLVWMDTPADPPALQDAYDWEPVAVRIVEDEV